MVEEMMNLKAIGSYSKALLLLISWWHLNNCIQDPFEWLSASFSTIHFKKLDAKSCSKKEFSDDVLEKYFLLFTFLLLDGSEKHKKCD